MFAALQNLENQLVAFLAVLAEQRLDVLERRRLERLEPVALVDVADHTNDVFAPANVVGEEIASTAWRFRRHRRARASPQRTRRTQRSDRTRSAPASLT